MSTKRFLGYDTDEIGKLVINRKREPIVTRLYQKFLDGKQRIILSGFLKENADWQSKMIQAVIYPRRLG